MKIKPCSSGYRTFVALNGVRISKTFTTIADAEAWGHLATAAILQKRSLSVESPGRGTFKEACDLAYERRWRGTKAEDAVVRILATLQQWFKAGTYMEDITTDRINSYVAQCQHDGNGNSTVNRKLAILKVVIDQANIAGLNANQIQVPRLREGHGRTQWLTPLEIDRVLTEARIVRPWFGDLVTFLVDTGCRVGEVFNLQWSDVTRKPNGDVDITLRDTKNGSSRTLPCPSRIILLLDGRLSLASPFADADRNQVNRMWNRMKFNMGKAQDNEFVPHALRHTCASRLAQAGLPLLALQKWMGHKTLAMTQRYAHLDTSCLNIARNAINALNLNSLTPTPVGVESQSALATTT